MDKGKCEIDKNKDCAWVLIYKELEKKGQLEKMRKFHPAKDYQKTTKPHRFVI